MKLWRLLDIPTLRRERSEEGEEKTHMTGKEM
jgi:hypothetical protein